VLYIVVALGLGVFAGVKAERADHRWFVTAATLVAVGYAIVFVWGLVFGGGFGALYWGVLVVLMGIGCLIAYAIAAMRQRSRRRPFDGT
jgi:hypothetical protein